jgi:hypothetical protein
MQLGEAGSVEGFGVLKEGADPAEPDNDSKEEVV